MATLNTDALLREADQLIEAANEEIQRAEEDVISHMVCMNSRQSLINYFKGYLHRNGETPREPATLSNLLDQCRKLDGRFGLIDLTGMNCRNHVGHDDYCMEVKTVSKCLDIAKQVRAIVQDNAPAY